MRIVAGRWRGHSLFVPDIPDTRPTMDRTRQAVFNILRSANWAMDENDIPVLENAHILDVFAGSGAMGFEALSQGASSAVFFELHPVAIHAIEKNSRKLKADALCRILKTDVRNLPFHAEKVAQIAFFDPPYKQELIPPALVKLLETRFIDLSTLLVIETHKFEIINETIGLDIIDERKYGLSKIVFCRLTA